MAKKIKTALPRAAAQIETDLKSKLECNGTLGAYYDGLVYDYLKYWEIRRQLQEDIDTRGAKVSKFDSRGQEQLVNNESIDQLLKVHASMLKILESLGIRAEDVSGNGVDGDDL